MEENTRLNSLAIEFSDALRRMDRPRCVSRALEALHTGETDLVDLYTRILAPALNEMTDAELDTDAAIWREHIRSSIIRSVVECCYPWLQEELIRKGIHQEKGKAVLLSPSDELHDLGARMGADFFALAGYETIFVGTNTPKSDILAGLRIERPRVVIISVVNSYNIFKVKNMMEEIAAASPESRILVSGSAFYNDKDLANRIGAGGVIKTYEDIEAL